jgi:hypothetical protein
LGVGTSQRQQLSNSLTSWLPTGNIMHLSGALIDLGMPRCPATFPTEDNALFRKDFLHRVGTGLLGDFVCFLVQEELSNHLKHTFILCRDLTS